MTKKRVILLVEDEISLRRVLKVKLVATGYRVLEAKDGKQGLNLAIKNKPDLILLDIIMPVMDGLTMLSKLRQDKAGADIPVIMLTNLNDTEKMRTAKAGGVSDYLIKTNWTLKDLLKLIKQKIG
jgi:CheY-like chemotaxis protein